MTKTYADSAVAVIGMACRLPGANDLEQFWELVRAGRAAWGPIPDERLNRKLYYDPRRGVLNRTYSDLAALVSYRPVDRQLCPISEKAIASYDPAHVTLCEVAAAACRHAGFDPAAIPHPNTGVYVGHAAASGLAAELTYATYISRTAGFLREAVGFEQLGQGLGEEVIREIIDEVRRDCPRRSPDGAPYFGASLAAGLISRTFALDGPYMSFNAACASSSRALVQAMRALQLGNVDMAMVGGASYFHSDTLVLFAQSHSLSPTGSHPFSAGADGMIVGEGYAVLVLKMLSRAIADGNRVLAVIPSVGLSSDGRGKSLWAPRQEGQIEAIGRAYGDEVAIDRLEYIEAHATSTSLGDVTEVASLTKVLDGRLPPGKKIAAGSAKLNVGHTLEVAGLVGVLKTILALNHDVIPPAIDDRPLNPQIDWENAPIYVPRTEVPWPRHADGTPRRAGVNAFGIGGLNVHVVVDDFVGSRPATSRAASLPPASVATEKGSKAEGNGREDSKPAAVTEINEDGAVAIIGRGAVMPGALTLEAFWELLTSGRDPKIDSPEGRWNPKDFLQPETEPSETRGGYVTGFEYDWRKHKIPPKEIAQASPLQFMILDAVDQAIQRSGYRERPFDRRRVGVVVGTTFGGACAAELAVCLRLPEFQETLARLLREKGIAENLIEGIARSYGDVLLKHMPILLDETGSFTASALASRITKTFDLMGSAVAVDAAGGSSMAALGCCVEFLRAGDCDMMVCVGGEQDLTPVHFEEWSIRGRLPAAAPRSPMDARADGIVPGEGCGAILLKRLSDARRDGDPIFGIVRGVGAAYDPCQNRAVRLAVGRALTDAGASADDVGLVETTATGLARDDAAQWQGLAEALNHPTRSHPAVLSSAAGQLGDSGAGAGMAALLKATMEIDSLAVPRDPGIEQPSPQLVRHADVLTVPLASTTLAPNRHQTVLAGIHSGSPEEVTYHAYIERSTKITTEVQTMKPALETAKSSATLGRAATSPIPHFDATERRRAKMRDRARAVPASPATAQPPVPEYHSPPATTAAPPPPASPTEAAAEVTNLDAKELESFLVNFVVEHTGYPPEIVELDADLEADLGIDSIKKAQ
ncbi:MAG: hypothetical protein GX621_14245, partial [Pirellulaceae bacterium]|nr:hypothetical protein [Pirellulaceae bacterium]